MKNENNNLAHNNKDIAEIRVKFFKRLLHSEALTELVNFNTNPPTVKAVYKAPCDTKNNKVAEDQTYSEI